MKTFWIFVLIGTSSMIIQDAHAGIFDCGHLDEILSSNHQLHTYPTWYKQWSVSFKVKPLGKVKPWSNIFHATAGGNCCKNGDRIPAIWFFPNSFKLHIRHSINNNGNGGVDTHELPVNKYTSVLVQQKYVKGKYIFSVYLNGKHFKSIVNKNPKRYHNVKTYSTDPWYLPANAYVKDLVVSTHKGPDFVWECHNHATPWNSEGGGNAAFLDRHPIACPANHALKQFYLIRNGKGSYQYRYICCQLPHKCERNVVKATLPNDDGGGNMLFLDRHQLQCSNNYITAFRLLRPTSKTYQYRYTCCVMSRQKTCYIGYTPFNSDGGGNTVFLDRQRVTCAKYHHFLTAFKLSRDGSHKRVRYAYQCCRESEGFKNGRIIKNRLVGVVHKWHKQWRISFTIKPVHKHAPWTNILHFTTGENCCSYGRRVPGIWFRPGTHKLFFSNSVSGHGNAEYRYPPELPTNSYTSVIVEQKVISGKYIYRIFINGKVVYSIENTHPSYFYNVNVFASDPWYFPADALVSNLKYSSYPGPALPAWKCAFKATPWNSEGGGNNAFLDRHHVYCGPNHAIQSLHLVRNGHGKYRYNYVCCRLPINCIKTVAKHTLNNADGGGNMFFLDRHFLKCSNEHHFITEFRLIRPSKSTIRYNYGCCVLPESKECYNFRTPLNDSGGGNVVFLDRHKVQCKANYGMTAFKVERSGNKVRYYYECCTL